MKINVNGNLSDILNCFVVYFILFALLVFTFGCTSTPQEIETRWKEHWCESVAAWEIDYCETEKDCEDAEVQLQYFKDSCK